MADDDEKIQLDVVSELGWDTRVPSKDVGVTVRDGVVNLYGEVYSHPERRAAEKAAYRVSGVRSVTNDLRVRLPIELSRTDSDIAAAALHAIEWDTWIPSESIHVTVSDGWLELTGVVDWYWQSVEADQVVGHIRGVRGVTSHITVHPRVAPSATQTKNAIEAALVRDAQTDAARVTVEVHDHTVVLKGSVRSWAERVAA